MIKTKRYIRTDDQDEGSPSGSIFSRLFYGFIRPYRRDIFFSLILLLMGSMLGIISAKFFGVLVEKGLIPLKKIESISYSVIIIFAETCSVWLVYKGRVFLTKTSSLIIFDIRNSLFLKLKNLSMSYFDHQPQGRIVTRITHDVEGIEDFFTSNLSNLVSAFLVTSIALVAMLVSHLKLGLLVVLLVSPTIIFMYATKDLLRNSNRLVSKLSSAINARLSENINGFELIKNFGIEDWSMRKYSQSVDEYLRAQLRGNFLFASIVPIMTFLASIPLIGLVWFGGNSVMEGLLSLGIFISFIRYFDRFFNPLILLTREIHVVQQALTSIERVMNFLNEPEESHFIIQHQNKELASIRGDIKFRDLYMRYDEGSWVLQNINFHILPGQKIGLVGRTGCGKSTTVSLIMRLYEFQQGDILIDNVSIRDIDLNFLRRNIGFVTQDPVIFRGTLRENLVFEMNLPDASIIEAAKNTGLFFTLSRPNFNLDMSILEDGANLSIGERQLLSLTRVLLRNPALLILDEATANIDPHYEALIQAAIEKLLAGRTCLIIAHRLDTIKKCDCLLVYQNGEIIERGSFQDLLDKQSYFYELCRANSI